jgi:hypothetical protein
VSGADISPGSVAVARRRQPGLAFLVADMCGLPEAAGFAIRERHERAPYPDEYPSPRLYLWAEVPPAR